MAVCLDYQSIYLKRDYARVSFRTKLVCAAVLLSALAFKIWIKIETTDIGYQLARERSRSVELDQRRRELELELSVSLRPDNLARRAQKELGLSALNPGQARKIRS